MKALMLLLLLAVPLYGDVNKEAQKFTLTVTITYNAVTLEEATKIEAQVRRNHVDACKVILDVIRAEAVGTGARLILDSVSICPHPFNLLVR